MQWDLPSAVTGGPGTENEQQVGRQIAGPRAASALAYHRRAVRPAMVAVTALVLALATAVPAQADDLTDRRDQVNQQIDGARSNLSESSTALDEATARLQQSRTELAEAQARLADTQSKLTEARQADQDSAARLAEAQAELEQAKAAVAEGRRNLDAKHHEVGTVVRSQYQQRNGLVGIGMWVNGESTGEVGNRAQWADTVFNNTQSELDRLNETQRRLDEARNRQADVETKMAQERAAAAANLEYSRQLEAAAADQERTVTDLVTSSGAAESAARAQVEADEKRIAGLTDERDQVQQRISARIAEQRAAEARLAEEAARRAVAEREAREAAAAETRSSALQAAGQPEAAKAAVAPKSASAGGVQNLTASRPTESHGFIYPSGATLTSAFGMRLHPVLNVWKLHDGTDFGAGCGTPIRAAHNGVVTERYYNAGYGNRLMIDHGKVDGRYVTTGYNHAINYTVAPGDRVEQGQTIGFVGNTGYSTGCHLHFMVWLDGELSNPMSWY